MKNKYKEMLIVGMCTALMGQVNFYPFGTDFRITIGVVAFTFLLLYFHTIPIISSSIITGLSVLMLRVGIDIFANSMGLEAAFYKHMPGMMYYITYGIIIEGSSFRKLFEKPIFFIMALTTADILSNIFELLIRNQLNNNSFDAIFSTIMLAAVIRSCLVLALFWIIKYYSLFVTKEEHQKRYKELLILTSKLKSEIFFLKKSMQDIENAMAKSYRIYNTIKESNPMGKEEIEKITADCLNLSIDIHEIKKDYNRIVISMEKLMPTGDIHKTMRISEIFETIGDIFDRYIEVISKDITLSFEMEKNYRIKEYFIIMSILNNLIQNSVEACFRSDSFIKVRCFSHESMLFFAVSDNGKGIGEKERELIFEPGFTTKFNPETGHVSTGLGLTHIKILLEHLEGKIKIDEGIEGITQFVLEIPMDKIVGEVDDND
ncbi:MAG TPA: ATP-binding protein [Bacillota bacterium]|nr:ATP-binding protein [Bacillota bacterium]HQJ38206.1 ATP-binding protein [Bacillota bacterium]HQL37002.1 ATP-binding protein [Bacillota bacterium]